MKNDPPATHDGQRVFTCGHSFHSWVAPILAELAGAAGIVGHEVAGVASIGGSAGIPPYLNHHWNVPDETNLVKRALRTGGVDVLTLSPVWLPDPGIDQFTALALEHNPNTRILVQAYWLPNDTFDTAYPLPTKRQVNHNDTQMLELRSLHALYFQSVEGNVRAVNEAIGRPPDHPAVFVVPVGQAVLPLREKILAGEAGPLMEQWDLFHDCWGHPLRVIQSLAAYCHFAVIYRRSPVGLPVPSESAMAPHWPEKRDWRDAGLHRLLQGLAWDAVRGHGLSGVSAG